MAHRYGDGGLMSDSTTNGKSMAGERVIVTGGGSGIGRELSHILLERGARVVCIDRDVRNVPSGCTPVLADLGNAGDAARGFEEAIRELGGVDVLCNNAGIGSTSSVVDSTVEEWDAVFDVNVRAAFIGMKVAIPHMLAQGRGVIVNTASAAALVGPPDRAAYGASKGAIISLTKQVAIQYAKDGIRCNSVCPGTVDTPWVARLLHEAHDPKSRRAELVARQPMGLRARPREIALGIAWLAGPESSFMTGSELLIDGGVVAG